MKEREPAVDLSNCDREPIHVPGAIQPHGVLLALAEPALTVAQISDNVGELLQVRTEDALGRPLADVIGPDAVEQVRTALVEERWDDVNPIRVGVNGQRFDGIVHRHAGVAILELEPALTAAAEPLGYRPLRLALGDVQQAVTLPQLCESVVREVRRLTGYQRVMLYRFDEHGHGSVDAEDRAASLEPYLGLHYPASDIPQQARQLYLKNWLRIIPDARYTPVPIVPALRPATGTPLDLGLAVLRSVSPVHLEYLENIGIRASMSISLIVRNRLWGLISCAHHAGPLRVPYELRSICEVLGRLVSLQIAALEDREAAMLRAARRGTHEVLTRAMQTSEADDDVLVRLLTRPSELLALVGADGAAVVTADELGRCGRTPRATLIRSIASWLDERGESTPFATASLAAHLAAARDDKEVGSGLLAIALPGTPPRRLLWFRPEVVHTVSWGGDPRKPVEVDPRMRLHPRRSFEQWKEEVRLRARAWTASDLEAAEELRRDAVEIDLTHQVAREQRAVRARDEVVAVVSHDLKNPLSAIQLQASVFQLATDEQDPSRQLRTSAARIQRSVDRMNTLINDLLDLAKIEARRFTIEPQAEDTRALISAALGILRPLAESKRITILEELRDTPRVHADRERIFQVLSNLVSNAIKFTPPGGTITLETERAGPKLVFSVTDTGPGIPPDDLTHVFDRYWQARRTNKSGSGLGLYIAKGIVEAHEGRIWVEVPDDGGARFRFTLPIEPSAAPTIATHPAPST